MSRRGKGGRGGGGGGNCIQDRVVLDTLVVISIEYTSCNSVNSSKALVIHVYLSFQNDAITTTVSEQLFSMKKVVLIVQVH